MDLSLKNRALLLAVEKGYKLSDNGNSVINKNGNKLKLRDIEGYLSFAVRIQNNAMYIKVHRLVAYFKYGNKIFNEGTEVRHKNSNKYDNSFENILIGTHSENMLDTDKEERIKRAIHASNKTRRFTDEEIIDIRKDREKGLSYKQLCIKYNTSKSSINYIITKSLYYKKIISAGSASG